MYQTHREIHRVLSNQRVLPRSSLFHSAGLREFRRRMPFSCASGKLYITMCRNRTRCFHSFPLSSVSLKCFPTCIRGELLRANLSRITRLCDKTPDFGKQHVFKANGKRESATHASLRNEDFKRKSTCPFAVNLRDEKTILASLWYFQ